MPMAIAFDQTVYCPGSFVSGHVVIVRKSPQKVKGLTLRFLGRASRTTSDNDSPIKSHKKELYFDEKVDIFGHDGLDATLKVGENLFPFRFPLPPGLPSSFSWSRGNILYFVEARLTRSSWKEDKKASVRLNVEGLYDLNYDPLASLPSSIHRSKYVQHLLSKSGPLAFTLSTTRSGFVRGHSLVFHLELKNLSKLDCKRCTVSLYQEVAQDGKHWSSLVQEMKGPAVLSGELQSWDGRLKIPPDLPPTNLGNILQFHPGLSLQYFLQVDFSPKSATVEGLTGRIPVSIGTLPLDRGRARFFSQSHEETCPLSHSLSHSGTNANAVITQFSPGTVHPQGQGGQGGQGPVTIQVQMQGGFRGYEFETDPSSPCPQCRTDRRHFSNQRAILRRLRNLQRRRRESPPPTYDEVVGESRVQGNTIANSTEPEQRESSSARNTNRNDASISEAEALPGKNHEDSSNKENHEKEAVPVFKSKSISPSPSSSSCGQSQNQGSPCVLKLQPSEV